MRPIEGISQKFGPYVGIDAEHTGDSGVQRYWKDIRKGLKTNETFEETIGQGVKWISVKNKFFTQVLTLESGDESGSRGITVRGGRGEGEALIGSARPSVRLDSATLEPGGLMRRAYTYYVGPVSMDRLQALGGGQEKVIDFRLFRVFVPIATLMMKGLNTLHGFTGNWGVAIILLTFVVRMLFWPLTQKGAENMKRMSELSPQMKALREKYNNNPQKLNQEMAAFYKEHKVNPMAGCLPMLVQIPVFISLYGVLRVAVELRFADFLWIRDLSEQEAIFMLGGFTVNILPLTMGATMILQQRLTPSNMDPQQQKIMTMMPIVFLFITYTMPSGLLLYWTTSNLVSIYQTTHTRRRDAKREAAKEGGSAAPAKTPPAGKKKSPGKK
jgi:YidC/Oxa1 family membrane protein insertase